MSGHSKWSQIKRQKETTDQKRGQAFTKLANAITIAVKSGGGIADPELNFKLRLTIEKARAANMPKENIQRSIERAKGSGTEGLQEIIYEGFGPLGVAILIEAATDNRQRTAQELKNIFETGGGNLAGPGATTYLFRNMGMITVEKESFSADQIMEKAIEIGAEDIEEVETQVLIYTRPEELHQAQEKLIETGFKIIEAELIFKPISTVLISNSNGARKTISLLNRLEESENVLKVFANFDIPDELLEDQ